MIPAIASLPRVKLGFFPTPLTDAQHLSSVLGKPHIFIKRDDLTGLALGGNKCRRLEFIMGYAKEQGYNAIVSTAYSQSNRCVQIAATARKLNMKPCFVLLKGVHNETQGNLLLHNIMDSEVEIVGIDDPTQLSEEYLDERIEATANRLRSTGYKPLVMKHNLPAIDAVIGPAGWLNAADEIAQQLQSYGISSSYIILANGTGETQGALTLGLKYLKTDHRVIGISVADNAEATIATVIERANTASEYFGLNTMLESEDVEVTDEYIGEGYGVPTSECLEAVRLLAQTEGIFIDPVYTGKAMAGLIDFIRKGRFQTTDIIVFLHTGGLPALFAYDQEIIR